MSRSDDIELLLTFCRAFGDHINPSENPEDNLATSLLHRHGLHKNPGIRSQGSNDLFLSAADLAEVMGESQRRVGDLMARLGVHKSQRGGYRITDLVAVERRVRTELRKSDPDSIPAEGKLAREVLEFFGRVIDRASKNR